MKTKRSLNNSYFLNFPKNMDTLPWQSFLYWLSDDFCLKKDIRQFKKYVLKVTLKTYFLNFPIIFVQKKTLETSKRYVLKVTLRTYFLSFPMIFVWKKNIGKFRKYVLKVTLRTNWEDLIRKILKIFHKQRLAGLHLNHMKNYTWMTKVMKTK